MGDPLPLAQRRKLIQQLRQLEQEGRNVPGYAEYLEKMSALDQQMESLCRPDSWGVTRPLDEASLTQLRQAIQDTAMAGETYIQNVRQTMRNNKKISLKKGAPGIVNALQGILAHDAQVLGRFDPSLGMSLPQVLESARTRTLILGDQEMASVSGNQNARIPLSIQRADGKQYRGVFTKATYSRVGKSIQDALVEVEEEIPTEAGKQEFHTIMDKLRVWFKKKHPKDPVPDDVRLFLYGVESHTALGAGRPGYIGRPMFEWSRFCEAIGLDQQLIGTDALRTLGARAVKIRYRNTSEMINLLDLKVDDGARIDSRNGAMSAVADLLGTSHLLARSTNMRFTDGEGRVQEGTVMDYGKGLDLNDDLSLFKQVNDAPFAGPEGHKALRQLADLQALDYICGNVDRHAGNIMYETNEAGDIVGIQGIDNDSSFGSFANGAGKYNRLPGTGDMNCISKTMSNTIMNLDPSQLRFMLRGRGLTERELDFSVKRLNDLKQAIRAGKEHYKNHPPINSGTEKPFDKGFLRTVSDEEFNHVTLAQLSGDPEQKNLFGEVRDFMASRLKHARLEGYNFDPAARAQAQEKQLPERKLQGQTYNGGELLKAIRGSEKLVREGAFNIDNLTTKRRGSSPQFDSMVTATKKLALLEQKLAQEMQQRQEQNHLHFSAVEYERLRRPIDEARSELETTADTYLKKKMRERGARTLEQLRGKNPYEQARIDHAKKILDHAKALAVPQPIPEKVLAAEEGEGLEIKVGNQLSVEEEARVAFKMLQEIHKQHGLKAPQEYKGMGGAEFQQQVNASRQAQNPQGPQNAANPQGPQNAANPQASAGSQAPKGLQDPDKGPKEQELGPLSSLH